MVWISPVYNIRAFKPPDVVHWLKLCLNQGDHLSEFHNQLTYPLILILYTIWLCREKAMFHGESPNPNFALSMWSNLLMDLSFVTTQKSPLTCSKPVHKTPLLWIMLIGKWQLPFQLSTPVTITENSPAARPPFSLIIGHSCPVSTPFQDLYLNGAQFFKPLDNYRQATKLHLILPNIQLISALKETPNELQQAWGPLLKTFATYFWDVRSFSFLPHLWGLIMLIWSFFNLLSQVVKVDGNFFPQCNCLLV